MFGSQFKGKVCLTCHGAVVTVAGVWDSKLHGIVILTVRKQRAVNLAALLALYCFLVCPGLQPMVGTAHI